MYTIEFREMWSLGSKGNVAGKRIQYRRKMVLINILGVSLSEWGPWEDFNLTVVTESV